MDRIQLVVPRLNYHQYSVKIELYWNKMTYLIINTLLELVLTKLTFHIGYNAKILKVKI